MWERQKRQGEPNESEIDNVPQMLARWRAEYEQLAGTLAERWGNGVKLTALEMEIVSDYLEKCYRRQFAEQFASLYAAA